jgi:hypothetical protein
MMQIQIRESIVRIILISVVYAIIESHFTPQNEDGLISVYHILVLLIGIITGFDRKLRIWIANILLYSVLEDAFYWIFKQQLPYQWSPEYIVIYHIPIYYIPFSIIAIILYTKKNSR